MADGFGFHFDADAAASPPPVLLEPAAGEPAAEEAARPVEAGVGAAPAESWWGELVEFAVPILACVAFAAATTALAPNGWALLSVGFRV